MPGTKDDAFRSQYFCMLPWLHLHLWPDGKAFPCCFANPSKPVGNAQQQSLSEIWNSASLRQIRKNMLNNEPSAECKKCYYLENLGHENSFRQRSLSQFAQHWPIVETTESDGRVPQLKMALLDIRFSNLCNFRCHTCNSELSSAWFEESAKLGMRNPPSKVLNLSTLSKDSSLWSELEPLLDGVEEATFAGGEPLLSQDHFRILHRWTERKNFNVRISYLTNFSELEFRGSDVLKLWSQFPNLLVQASLDGSGKRAEYLRHGTNWQKIVRNRQRMLRECPQVTFALAPTISLFNVEHFANFHWEWIQEGLVRADDLEVNLLTYPDFMRVQVLPMTQRARIAQQYEVALDRILGHCERLGQTSHSVENGYQSIVNLLKSEPLKADDRDLKKARLLHRIRSLDRLRDTDFRSTFPEIILD